MGGCVKRDDVKEKKNYKKTFSPQIKSIIVNNLKETIFVDAYDIKRTLH